MNILRRTFVAAIVGVFVVAGIDSTRAALIADLAGPPVPVGTNFAYDYRIDFGAGTNPDIGAGTGTERLDPGDFVTLYDVAGPLSPLVGPPIAPANFTAAVNLIGANASGTAPFDNPALSNVTFVYTGPTVFTDTLFTGFRIVTTQNAVANIAYTSETTDAQGVEAGSPIGHIGTARGPLGIIPEPGTVALTGIGGLIGLFMFRRRRS